MTAKVTWGPLGLSVPLEGVADIGRKISEPSRVHDANTVIVVSGREINPEIFISGKVTISNSECLCTPVVGQATSHVRFTAWHGDTVLERDICPWIQARVSC